MTSSKDSVTPGGMWYGVDGQPFPYFVTEDHSETVHGHRDRYYETVSCLDSLLVQEEKKRVLVVRGFHHNLKRLV